MKHLVELEMRPKRLGTIAGFVMNSSDELILLHRLEKDTFRLNGYCVVREKMVGRYRVFDSPQYWQFRATKQLGLKPTQPRQISLIALPASLRSIAKSYPLLTVHREKINPEGCYIGRLRNLNEETFTIEDLDSNAEWTGPRRMKLNDVTRVDFGGGYENALALTAPKFPATT